MAAVGVLAIGVAVVAFAMVLRSERGARTVGHSADRLANSLTRRLGHGRTVDLTGKILDFRSSVVGVASFILITPGGLGTVDAALTALLTGYGATSSQALAADLVWRAATYVPQVLLGALAFLWWRVAAARRKDQVTERSPSG